MHVTIVAEFDATTARPGGTRAYAEGLEAFVASEGIPHLLVSAGSGGWTGENRYEFPIRRRGSNWSFQSGLYACVKALPVPRDTIVHAQRPETLIPFAVARQGLARICTLHGSPGRAVAERRGWLVGALYREVERIALLGTARVIAIDTGTREEYQHRYPWLRDRLRVIPNAVDGKSFHPMDRTEAKRRFGIEGTTFLYAGRLEPEKRVLEILQAFRSVGNDHTTLLIAGSGTQRSIVEMAARNLPVRLLGDIAHLEIPNLLNASDALVLFSEREGLPTVALEALACGTPVITTRVGDLPDLIRDGETGYLVSDVKDLESAMRHVRDGVIRQSSSIAISVASYDWRKIGRRILGVYEEVWNARDT